MLNKKATVDYTKFRLKPEAEIQGLLKNISDIFVTWCRKCYKEFEVAGESECNNLQKYLSETKIKITSCVGIDFLCNTYLIQLDADLQLTCSCMTLIKINLLTFYITFLNYFTWATQSS